MIKELKTGSFWIIQKVKVLVTHSSLTLCDPPRIVTWLYATPWTVAHQAPLFRGFSRQEYCSGLQYSPGDLPDSGIEAQPLESPALVWVGSLPLAPPGKVSTWITWVWCKIWLQNREGEFSRKREMRDLLWSIGLYDYGHWEVPQFAVCKLKTQESKLCNLKAWEQGADGVDSSLGTKGLRIRSAGGNKIYNPA